MTFLRTFSSFNASLSSFVKFHCGSMFCFEFSRSLSLDVASINFCVVWCFSLRNQFSFEGDWNISFSFWVTCSKESFQLNSSIKVFYDPIKFFEAAVGQYTVEIFLKKWKWTFWKFMFVEVYNISCKVRLELEFS